MVKNVGTVDRVIRAILGILFLVGAFLVMGTVFKVILAILAIVMLFTAITQYCPLYKIFGMSTCPLEGKK